METKWLVSSPIAHRGLHDKFCPENSILAFIKAHNMGFSIELDVHLTKDNVVVCHHDYGLFRSCNVDKKICDLTFDEIRKFKIFGSNQTIPTLQEVIDTLPNANILVEIKNEGKVGPLERTTLQILRNLKGNFAIQSFNPFSIKYIHKIAPDVSTGILSSGFKNEKISWIKKFSLSRMIFTKNKDVDFVSYNIDDVPNKYIKRYKIKLAWVCKSQAQMDNICKYVDNVIFESFIPKA